MNRIEILFLLDIDVKEIEKVQNRGNNIEIYCISVEEDAALNGNSNLKNKERYLNFKVERISRNISVGSKGFRVDCSFEDRNVSIRISLFEKPGKEVY